MGTLNYFVKLRTKIGDDNHDYYGIILRSLRYKQMVIMI